MGSTHKPGDANMPENINDSEDAESNRNVAAKPAGAPLLDSGRLGNSGSVSSTAFSRVTLLKFVLASGAFALLSHYSFKFTSSHPRFAQEIKLQAGHIDILPSRSLPETYALCSHNNLEPAIYTVDDEDTKVQCIVVHKSRIEDTGTLGALPHFYSPLPLPSYFSLENKRQY